jgi:hypothetical protein
MHLITFPHAGTITDTDEGEDDATITNLHIILDVHEGEYLTVVADFCLGADFGLGGYFRPSPLPLPVMEGSGYYSIAIIIHNQIFL